MKARFSTRSVTLLRLAGIALGCVSGVGLIRSQSVLAGTVARASDASAKVASMPARRTGALRFEPNRGQFEAPIRYLARGKAYGLYLTDEGATLVLQPSQAGKRALVSLRIAGARSADPVGIGELPGHNNYAVGTDPGRWLRDVPSFGGVSYPGILPGVDLVFYSNAARELEYDFTLAPRVSPEALELVLDGVVGLETQANGDVLLRLPDGAALREPRPVAYQVDDGGVRRFVTADFRVLGPTRLGFRVTGNDPRRALVIDPVLTYATYLGGSRFDEFDAVGADSQGNTYAVAYTTGSLFPTKVPAQPGYGGGASDAIIVKLNAAGSDFVYSTYLGGSDSDQAYGVAVDASGNAYVTGVTYSANFPTRGAAQPTFGGGLQDAFVVKLNGAGALVYSTYLGGAADDVGQAITVGAAGEAYVTGTTFSANFPKLGAYQSTLAGTNDAFVTKLSIAGSSLTYSTLLGGSGGEYGQAIALDSLGGAIVAGQTGSSNFPVQSAAQSVFGGSLSDAFVSRLNPTGSGLIYSTYLGGTSADVATGVAQVGGAAVVVGYTSSANFPTVGAAQSTLGGSSDAFLARVHATGGSFDYSTFLGGAGADQANAVVVDGLGFSYVVGQTSSNNFPLQLPFPGGASLSGSQDAFVAAFSGGEKQLATLLGGSDADTAVGIAVGGGSVLHVLGNTFSTNFPTVSGFFNTALGPQDGFVARITGLSLTPAPAGPRWLWLSTSGLLLGLGLLALSFHQGPRRA